MGALYPLHFLGKQDLNILHFFKIWKFGYWYIQTLFPDIHLLLKAAEKTFAT